MRLRCPQPDKLPLKCLELHIGSCICCCASRTFACRVALNDRTHTRMGGERHWRSIQFKHPVFLNEYFHSCLFFLDGIPTIKLLTAFFLEPGGSGWRYTPICGSQSI